MFRTAISLALTLALPVSWAAEPVSRSASSTADYVSTKSASVQSASAMSASTMNGSAAKADSANTRQPGSDARQSRYQDSAVAFDALFATQKTAEPESAGVAWRDPQKVATSQKTEPPRPATVALRSSSHDFRIWDAGRDLISDADGDGYYRRFEIRFDADVVSGDALVYAKLYLRRVGDSGPWEHYYLTDDFWIYGSSDGDDYYVETTLNDGYPTAEYDVLIDLYESGFSGIVATIGPFEDGSLKDLPLEDSGLDLPLPDAGYHIGDVDTTLLTDADHDGYYAKFTVSFDPDRDAGASMAYAVLRVRADGGDWQTEHTSAVFQVDESGDADRYQFTGEWLSGYRTARYDLQIDLYDAATNLLVASVSSERPELSRVPLEDAGRDDTPNGGGGGGGGDSDSSESGGGGSMTVLLLGLAAGLIYARWRLNRDRMLQRVRSKDRLQG